MERPLIGIDVGGTKMLMIARWPNHTDSDVVPTGSDITVEEAEGAIVRFLNKLPLAPKAIGIAVAGLLDQNGEVVSCEVLPRLLHWAPKRSFEQLSPVVVMNDAEAALSEESHDLPPKSTAAVVVVGTGTGAALIVDGKQVAGAQGWAGELGSIPIALCADDVKSLNDFASGGSILRDLGLSSDELLQRLLEQDERVIKRVKLAGTALGLGLATLINLLNPHRVVFGGQPSTLPHYAESALAAAKAYSFPLLWNGCDVRRSIHGGMLVVLGAARAADNSS